MPVYYKGNKVAPVLAGRAAPAGTLSITENGSHDVSAYATAEVNVPAGGGPYDKYEDIPELYKPYVEASRARLAERYPDAAYTDIIIVARPPWSLTAPEPFSYLYIYYCTEDFTVVDIGDNGRCSVYGCYEDSGLFASAGDPGSFRWDREVNAFLTYDIHKLGGIRYNDTARGAKDTLTAANSGGWIVYASTIVHYKELLLYPAYSTQDVAGAGALTYTWDSETGTLTIYATSAEEASG